MNQFQLGFLISRPVVHEGRPDDILFVERDIYEYALPLERRLLLSDWQVRQYAEAIRRCDRVMQSPYSPPEVAADAAKYRRIGASANPIPTQVAEFAIGNSDDRPARFPPQRSV
jgi:hypothetical protein